MMSIFSERLKELIASRGVTQAWVAKKANTTEATLSRYVLAKNNPPALEIVADIATALNCSTDYLLGNTNIPYPKESISFEQKLLIECYSEMSQEDITVLWALLDKYISPTDRDKLKQSLSEDRLYATV